ncbi:hypothetical protein BMETH_17775015721214, partial [methanotrophic bacterial endosymbiont of Bathymodiolus sp.]
TRCILFWVCYKSLLPTRSGRQKN